MAHEMEQKIPITLELDPIIEALFEIRFDGKIPPVADLLPGMLFPHIKEEFPKLEKLPTAQLPLEIRQKDPNLIFKPTHSLPGEKYNILFGDKVFTLSCMRPYQGWENFREKIHHLLNLLQKTDLISSIRRFSVKYVNIIPSGKEDIGLDKFKLDINLGPYDLKRYSSNIKTEIHIDKFLNIINIIPGAFFERDNLFGVLLDIDTICTETLENRWEKIPELLEMAHRVEKSVFYSVLKNETIENFRPIWVKK